MIACRTTRALALLTGLALASFAWGQDSSSQSLGDVARKTRKEHASADHIVAKQVTNEEEDGPDPGGVWRAQLCTQTPCYEISITLPKSPKWRRMHEEPRPVLIPLSGHPDDPDHVIRLYAAQALPRNNTLDGGTRTFLQLWFARPEYFGQAARILLKQYVLIDGRAATVAHFSVTSGTVKYRGVSVVAGTSYGDFGFACAFREEDAADAASICDAIVNSTRTATVQPAVLRTYPRYDPPQYYPEPEDPPDEPADPADDAPDNY